MVYPVFKNACPKCGTPYQVSVRKIEVVEGELSKVDKAALKAAAKEAEKLAAKDAERARTREEWACKSREELVKLARERGYKEGWVHLRWNQMQKTKWGRRKGLEETLRS
jgi:flagellar biosynthesis/type III secretory pathway protein FliH